MSIFPDSFPAEGVSGFAVLADYYDRRAIGAVPFWETVSGDVITRSTNSELDHIGFLAWLVHQIDVIAS